MYMGIMPTKIELTLEQSQQGVSNDVLVSIEGVEEIKGVKKEALHTLKAETGSIHMLSESQDTFPFILSFTHCGNKVILRVLRIILVILPEHPSDTKDHLKMEMEMEIPSVKASANSDIIFFFTSAQDGNKLLDDERLSLADDLKKAHDQNQNKSK
ncbi:hypothetical protein Tco_0206786 [Tanacetum coccineum]